ncbi:hypothetical protein [Leptospira alstonii]|uniref:Uncharacterized protein n=2 Tax=Leptospira alstonii TaxID=28452 RepID=M6D2W2_9LEPT|nr:hypothetical protein [Leptospira alstonii]EMJ98309.1 hypothetical protein LEP1GSC194_0924 [Leptospira alstonii serovar Sichuan str. 79601]EQA82635.1 hypothetical protein LEP1GSC193_1257 [Leptospira alstonii serovar Pingchang str. 80-412]
MFLSEAEMSDPVGNANVGLRTRPKTYENCRNEFDNEKIRDVLGRHSKYNRR